MARADLLKKLFSSFNNNDRELFMKTAHEIIADERKKNHAILADDLEMVLNGAQKNFGHSMSTMKPTYLSKSGKEERLVEIIYPDKYFDDVILPQEKMLQLSEVIKEFQNWDILISNGVAPINKLLFYGPPGCGKTLCANVLAAEIGIPLMYVRFDALVSSYLGETASNIRKVFDLAKNDSFVILFDEFDAIGRSRSDTSEHGEIKRVVNTFLQQIDCFRGRSIIIAATNFEQSLQIQPGALMICKLGVKCRKTQIILEKIIQNTIDSCVYTGMGKFQNRYLLQRITMLHFLQKIDFRYEIFIFIRYLYPDSFSKFERQNRLLLVWHITL